MTLAKCSMVPHLDPLDHQGKPDRAVHQGPRVTMVNPDLVALLATVDPKESVDLMVCPDCLDLPDPLDQWVLPDLVTIAQHGPALLGLATALSGRVHQVGSTPGLD